ncbi:MAG: helix-turn-helix domain-containing protein [Candidatus Hodarchaeales archaeon]
MLRIRGYKYEMMVNNKERTQLTKCAGIARITWSFLKAMTCLY